MADCPGVLHLAQMADGGLARLRVPGGWLSARQAHAIAEAAQRRGSGEIDLTNRANLQIRGLPRDGGPSLAAALQAVGFDFDGEAERRRNILLDPFSGEDPCERRDMRPLTEMLDARLRAAPWIGDLSPKFSFVFDGGGQCRIAGTPSDVAVLGQYDRLRIVTKHGGAEALTEDQALAILVELARTSAAAGPAARIRDLDRSALEAAFGDAARIDEPEAPGGLQPMFGAVEARDGSVAVSVPVAVGRLSAGELDFLAGEAEQEGRGELALAPWSAVVVPGVSPDRAAALLERAACHGLPPVSVVERLTVTACSGAPACERAREPAKDLARDILSIASRSGATMGSGRRSLHLSACPKGCAGSAISDLLLLGSSERPGWSIHRSGAPRRPGESFGRTEDPSPKSILALLGAAR